MPLNIYTNMATSEIGSLSMPVSEQIKPELNSLSMSVPNAKKTEPNNPTLRSISPMGVSTLMGKDTSAMPEITDMSIIDVIKKACREKEFGVIKFILKQLKSIPDEYIDDFGNTLLHYAIINFEEFGGMPFLDELNVDEPLPE